MKAANYPVDGFNPGYFPGVANSINNTGMGTAGNDDEALALEVNEQPLIIEQSIRLDLS